jgi:hypothetical protein
MSESTKPDVPSDVDPGIWQHLVDNIVEAVKKEVAHQIPTEVANLFPKDLTHMITQVATGVIIGGGLKPMVTGVVKPLVKTQVDRQLPYYADKKVTSSIGNYLVWDFNQAFARRPDLPFHLVLDDNDDLHIVDGHVARKNRDGTPIGDGPHSSPTQPAQAPAPAAAPKRAAAPTAPASILKRPVKPLVIMNEDGSPAQEDATPYDKQFDKNTRARSPGKSPANNEPAKRRRTPGTIAESDIEYKRQLAFAKEESKKDQENPDSKPSAIPTRTEPVIKTEPGLEPKSFPKTEKRGPTDEDDVISLHGTDDEEDDDGEDEYSDGYEPEDQEEENNARKEEAKMATDMAVLVTKYKSYYKQARPERQTRSNQIFLMTQIYSHATRFIRKSTVKHAALKKLAAWLVEQLNPDYRDLSEKEEFHLTHDKYQEGNRLTLFLDPNKNDSP